jgi:hypothetical protein
MPCEHPTEQSSDDLVPPAKEDAATERVVLINVLEKHPTQLTLDDIAQIVCKDPENFGEFDAVERATEELKRAGLLHINGAMITPTLSAITFDKLAGNE